MRFFVGLHQPSDAKHFRSAFISINRIRRRRGPFAVDEWIMDSGAYSEISTHGYYRSTVEAYASEIRRWERNGRLLAAVAQDWMCEDHVLAKTGLTVAEHQRLTIERYDQLVRALAVRRSRLVPCDSCGCGAARNTYIMPVLQGYHPADYVRCLANYGDRIGPGAWVGVGSVCRRNGDPSAIENVLLAVYRARPDLRLHGFGLKTTALSSGLVLSLLHSADSMAWSFAARFEGRDANDWREAEAWRRRIELLPVQWSLLGPRPH